MNIPTSAPVPVTQPKDFGTGVVAKITGTQSLQMTNVIPGEIAGPAVAVNVEYTNNSGKEVSLEQTIVTLSFDGQEASPYSNEPAKQPDAKLAPGKTAVGVYVFNVPPDKRNNVTIQVSYAPEAPKVQFNGKVG